MPRTTRIDTWPLSEMLQREGKAKIIGGRRRRQAAAAAGGGGGSGGRQRRRIPHIVPVPDRSPAHVAFAPAHTFVLARAHGEAAGLRAQLAVLRQGTALLH